MDGDTQGLRREPSSTLACPAKGAGFGAEPATKSQLVTTFE